MWGSTFCSGPPKTKFCLACQLSLCNSLDYNDYNTHKKWGVAVSKYYSVQSRDSSRSVRGFQQVTWAWFKQCLHRAVSNSFHRARLPATSLDVGIFSVELQPSVSQRVLRVGESLQEQNTGGVRLAANGLSCKITKQKKYPANFLNSHSPSSAASLARLWSRWCTFWAPAGRRRRRSRRKLDPCPPSFNDRSAFKSTGVKIAVRILVLGTFVRSGRLVQSWGWNTRSRLFELCVMPPAH